MDTTKFQPQTQEGLKVAFEIKNSLGHSRLGCDMAKKAEYAKFWISQELLTQELFITKSLQIYSTLKDSEISYFKQQKEKYDFLKMYDNFLTVIQLVSIANCKNAKSEIPLNIQTVSPRKFGLQVSRSLIRDANTFSKFADYYEKNGVYDGIEKDCKIIEEHLTVTALRIETLSDRLLF